MVEELTEQFLRTANPKDLAAIESIELMKSHFSDGTISAAIGEMSEKLVCSFTFSKKSQRNSWGHDLVDTEGLRIEVKGRLIDEWKDKAQFNFRTHTRTNAHWAYCLAWIRDPKVSLENVFRLPVVELCELWGRDTGLYCARTTLGKLKSAVRRAQI